MNKTYEDLENELIDFLEPIKPALPQFSTEVFDQVLTDAVEMIMPEDSDAITRESISFNLIKCGRVWYMMNGGG